MVLALGDKGPPQWHLSSVLGGEQQECLFQSLRAGILEWHLELLLDLLLGLDALRWPLHAELSFLPQCSASVLFWQSQEASVYSRQWATSLHPL